MNKPTATRMQPDDLAEHAEDAARLLKALSNRSRLMVMCLLVDGEMSVGELLEHVPLSQSALSQHLATLRRDGLVTTRRESQSILYSLAGREAARIVEVLHELYCGADT